jgi:hypothetical protein
MTNKLKEVQYVELITCMGGGFDCAVSEFEGIKTPNLHSTKEDGEEELQDIIDDYKDQVLRGEREDSNLDVEIFPCYFDGKILSVLNENGKEFISFDCSSIEC